MSFKGWRNKAGAKQRILSHSKLKYRFSKNNATICTKIGSLKAGLIVVVFAALLFADGVLTNNDPTSQLSHSELLKA